MDNDTKRMIILDNYQEPKNKMIPENQEEYIKLNSNNASCIDNINIYLNNKNLEPLIDQPIGYIFSGKSLVNLKVVDVGVIDSPYKLVKRFKDPNIINDVTNLYSRINFHKNAGKTNTSSLNSEKSTLPFIMSLAR